MIFDGKIPKSLFRDFQSVEKIYITFKYGVWGVAPSGVRAAAPHSAPFRGKGFGDRDSGPALFLKKHTFSSSRIPKSLFRDFLFIF